MLHTIVLYLPFTWDKEHRQMELHSLNAHSFQSLDTLVK